MQPNQVFDHLSQLNSQDVLVINNYHGWFPDNISQYASVVYTSFGEVFHHQDFQTLIDSAPETRFFIVTAQKYLLDYADGKNIYVYYLPTSYGQYSSFIMEKDFVPQNKKLVKKFLSLNYRSQWNRQALAQFLFQSGLIRDFYFSYHAHDRFDVGHRKLYDETNLVIGDTWFNEDLDFEELYHKLPIMTELPDPCCASNDWSFGVDEYYTNTFCSFVNETYTDQNHDPFFTEKTFKPIAYGHPFLLFSSAGALTLLQSLGFETFADVFDESYDLIESPQRRMEHLFGEVRRMCRLSDQELSNIHKKFVPRLIANQKNFRHRLPTIYQEQIESITMQIRALLPNRI